MSVLTEDFIGFRFNGIHSSELGIIRTSNGSRFDENLLPTVQDKTVQVPGGDGFYFFGSYYTQKQITVPIAFEAMTEQQLLLFRKTFGDKKIHQLQFDEAPYKVYFAKVTGTATIKHVPFTINGERIYRGEGTIQFTAYNPYAQTISKNLDDFTAFSTMDEWATASGLLWKATYKNYRIDMVGAGLSEINLYNPGVKESDFIFKIYFKNGQISKGSLKLSDNSQILSWETLPAENNDAYIKIDTKLNLVEGYDANNRKTGSVYNAYFTGTFFKIPVCNYNELSLILTDFGGTGKTWEGLLDVHKDYINSNTADKWYTPLEYNYYYF